MTTLLRPSARQAARLAAASVRTASRSRFSIARSTQLSSSTACLHQRVRPYSTESPKPTKKNKSERNQAKEDDGKKQAAELGKEDEISQEKPEDGKVTAEETPKQPLQEGWVYLSDEEIQKLKGLISYAPQGRRADFTKLLDTLAKNGAPRELHELLVRWKEQGGLSLADSVSAIRIATKVAKRIAETETEKEMGNLPREFWTNSQRPEEETQKKQETQETQESGQEEGKPKQEGQKKGQEKEFKEPEGFGTGDVGSWIGAIVLFYFLNSFLFPGGNSREITWQELRKDFLDKGLVEKLIVANERVTVELNHDATKAMYPDSPAANPSFRYSFSIGSIDAFERKLEEAQAELGIPPAEMIPVSYVSPSAMGNLLLAFGPTILIFGVLYFITRNRMGGGGSSGVFGFGKSKAKRFNIESSVRVKFADVAGMDEAKMEIMEFVSFLKSPEKFQRLGAKIPRGAVLAGPPGTGKTLLAKATAGESGVPFYSVSGSEFVEMFVGVGASRVRDLFATARKNSPCIIFIDEIDAIGKSRSDGQKFGGNEEREATLNQILTEMDGFNTSEQVVVLAGTNRPDILDKALMRPGRFDRHINIDRPTMKGRQDIFKVHLSKIVTREDMDYLTGRLGALTPGFSGADIANAVNEAALIAARANAQSVEMIHFEQAIERVIGGLERKSLVLSPEERRTVAYHEAGHAICGWFFKWADPLLKVSIIPRGQGALGYAQYLPGDAYLMTVRQLMDRMAMTLGGRISEELHFETVTTGASDDFRKVTHMATKMVTEWGMSEQLGPLHFRNDQNNFQKPFAESTAQTIDAEVRRIVDAAYKQCKDLLMEKKKEVGLIAEELLRKEVLTRDDMVRLLGPRPFKDNEEFAKFFNNDGGKSAPPPPPMEDTGKEFPDPQPTAFHGEAR